MNSRFILRHLFRSAPRALSPALHLSLPEPKGSVIKWCIRWDASARWFTTHLLSCVSFPDTQPSTHGKPPMQEWSQLLCSHLFIVIYWTSIWTVIHRTQTALIATTATSFPDSPLWQPSMIISCRNARSKTSGNSRGMELISVFFTGSIMFQICHDVTLFFLLWGHASRIKKSNLQNVSKINNNTRASRDIVFPLSPYTVLVSFI